MSSLAEHLFLGVIGGVLQGLLQGVHHRPQLRPVVAINHVQRRAALHTNGGFKPYTGDTQGHVAEHHSADCVLALFVNSL